MLSIKKILYPTDFSDDARQALNHALFLAEQFDAELHMLHVVTLHNDDPYNVGYYFESMDDISQRVKEVASSEMASLLKEHHDDTLNIVQVQRKETHPVPAILAYIDEQDIDLVVMGTHGRRGISQMFQGSVAEETVRLAPCPVLTVHGHSEQSAVEAFSKILVPIDFSEHSKHALANALDLARLYNAALQLVHVVESPSVPEFYVSLLGAISAETVQQLEKSSYDSLERLYNESAGKDGNVPTTTHVLHGRATQEITEFSETNDTDLIVLSTHGLTGLQRVVFGSVAEHVVRRANCPVLTLKAFPPTSD